VFGNGWTADHPHVAAIIGATFEQPEEVLPNYDLVFAVGRAAIEAMAIGCAVIVADAYGLGGLVTPVSARTSSTSRSATD